MWTKGPVAVQGQAGWGPRQPDLLVGSPVHGKGLELSDFCDPFQPQSFYDFMIL